MPPDGNWYWNGWQWLPKAVAGPAWARPYASPNLRAALAQVFVGLAAGTAAVTGLAEAALVVHVGLSAVAVTSLDIEDLVLVVTATGVSVVAIIGYTGAAISLPMWMHRCYRDLPAVAARHLSWSPRWAVWCWFIPLANLVIPYLVARDLWRGTREEEERGAPLLPLWWTFWIAFIVLAVAQVVGVVSMMAAVLVDVVASLSAVVAGILLILFIRSVTARLQRKHARLADA